MAGGNRLRPAFQPVQRGAADAPLSPGGVQIVGEAVNPRAVLFDPPEDAPVADERAIDLCQQQVCLLYTSDAADE